MIEIIYTHIVASSTGITDPFPQVQTGSGSNIIPTVFNILFGIIGGLSVLFVVLGGFRYIISGGNPQATAKAKDTILYALVGLTVTVAATAIVNFIFGNI